MKQPFGLFGFPLIKLERIDETLITQGNAQCREGFEKLLRDRQIVIVLDGHWVAAHRFVKAPLLSPV